MQVKTTDLEGVLVIEPQVFKDDRGFFMESYHSFRYAANGVDKKFIQDNLSFSVLNTLRGLHYQYPHSQAKLVQVYKGSVFDVVVDIRRGSTTFGQWVGVELSEKNCRQLFIPEGFAHGFCVLSDDAIFSYKCSDIYMPDAEGGVLWNDPDLGIDWPVEQPILSKKDTVYLPLANIDKEKLPQVATD